MLGGDRPRVVLVVAALCALVAGRAYAQQAPPAPLAPELLARAASLDPGVRMQAVGELRDLGTPAAWSLVVVMLQRDVDSHVREAAALALGASHNPEMAPVLDFAARVDSAPWVRAAAWSARAAVLPFAKRPKLAAGFSVLCPGCGYFYLGRPARALAYLGGAAALLATGFAVYDKSPIDPATGNKTEGRADPFFLAAQNLWFYGIYASYRDARLARGDEGARYPVAREELGDLLLAPFNPHVLKRPWVWAGIPVALGAAVGFTYIVSRVEGTSFTSSRTIFDPGGVQFFGRQYSAGTGFALGSAYNLGLFLPVGAGEEALFRGVIQAGLSETSLGLWGGWAVGSAIFGGAHVLNFVGTGQGGFKTAAVAVPYLMVTGSYLGLVYIRTGFSLRAGAAIHFWYDFLLSTIDFIADPDHQPFVARFAIPF
jgi:hypothetical protein